MEKLRLLFAGDAPDSKGGIQGCPPELGIEFPELGLSCSIAVESASSPERAVDVLMGENGFDIAVFQSQNAPGLALKAKGCGALLLAVTDSPELAAKAIANGAADASNAKELLPAILRVARRALIRRVAGRAAEQEGRRSCLPFAAMLSHELKSPLNAVEGYLRMMDAREAGEELSAYARMLKRSLARLDGMQELIRDVMELARLERPCGKGQCPVSNPREICAKAIEALEKEAQGKDVSISVEDGPPLIVLANPLDLEMIFSNLISNAIKYNRQSGEVRISLSKNQDTLSIRVADTGIGMTPEEASRIAVEFVRIKNGETREIPGSGLGLSIVKRLARLYGGDLKVESVKGSGSEFTATLKDGV